METARTSGPVRVAVLYDSDVVRHGLRQMLEPYAERVQVVVPGDDVAIGPVDVVLCDPDSSRAVVQRRALHGRTWPAARSVIYSRTATPDPTEASASRGVRGWVSMALPADELVDALVSAVREPVVPVVRPRTGRRSWPGQAEGLSERESEIVGYIVLGLSNERVAELSYLSVNTVKTYIRSAYRKMRVERRAPALLWAVDHGFRG